LSSRTTGVLINDNLVFCKIRGGHSRGYPYGQITVVATNIRKPAAHVQFGGKVVAGCQTN
jgi:hypothetical protein